MNMNILGRYNPNKVDSSTSSYKELKELSKSDSKRNGYLVVKDDGTLKRYGFIKFHLQGGKEKLQGDKLDRAICLYVAKKLSEQTPLNATEYQLIDQLAQRVLGKAIQSDAKRDIQDLLNAFRLSTSLSSPSPSIGEIPSPTSTLMPRETLNELLNHLEHKNVSEQQISSVVTKNFLKSLTHPDDISRMQVVIQNNPKIWEAVSACCSHDVSHTMASLNFGKNSLVAEHSKQGFVPDLKPTMQRALNILVKDFPDDIDFHIYKNLSPDLLFLTVERQMTSRKEPETKEHLGFLYNALCKDCLSSGVLEKASQQQVSTIVTKQFIQSLSDPDDITSMQKFMQINPAVKDAVAACCAKDILDSSNPLKKLAQRNFETTPSSIAKDLEIYTKLSHELVIGQFEQHIARESVAGTRKQLEQTHEVLCKNFFLSSSANEISAYVYLLSVEAAPEKMITKNAMESLLKQAQRFEDMNDSLAGAIAALSLVIDANAPLDTLLKHEDQVKQLGHTLTKHAEEHDEFYGDRLSQLEKIFTELNDVTVNVLIPAVSQKAAEIKDSINDLSNKVSHYEKSIVDAPNSASLAVIKNEITKLGIEIAQCSNDFRKMEKEHIENHPNEINDADRLQNKFEALNNLHDLTEEKLKLINYKNQLQDGLSKIPRSELMSVSKEVQNLQKINSELTEKNTHYEGVKSNTKKFNKFSEEEKNNQEVDYLKRIEEVKVNKQLITELENSKTLTYSPTDKISLSEYKKQKEKINIALKDIANLETRPLNLFINANQQELGTLLSQSKINHEDPLIKEFNSQIDLLKKAMDKAEGKEFRHQEILKIPNNNVKHYVVAALFPNIDTKVLKQAENKEKLAEIISDSDKKMTFAPTVNKLHSQITQRQQNTETPLKIPSTITPQSLQQFEAQLEAYQTQSRVQRLKNEKFLELFNQLLPKIADHPDAILTLSKIVDFMPKPKADEDPLIISQDLKQMYRNTGELLVTLSESQINSLVDKANQNEKVRSFIINSTKSQKQNDIEDNFPKLHELITAQRHLEQEGENAKIAASEADTGKVSMPELDQIVATLQGLASRTGWMNSAAKALMESRIQAGLQLLPSDPKEIDAQSVEAFNRIIDFDFNKNMESFKSALNTAVKEFIDADTARALLDASKSYDSPLSPNFTTILEAVLK